MFFFSDSVKPHLSRRHLSVYFLFNLVVGGGRTFEKHCALTKAASIPARHQRDNAGPRLLGFIFRRCPLACMFASFLSSTL